MTRENGMRFLIAAVFSVALSVSSGAFAQGAQPCCLAGSDLE
jgi:hypothetical protein